MLIKNKGNKMENKINQKISMGAVCYNVQKTIKDWGLNDLVFAQVQNIAIDAGQGWYDQTIVIEIEGETFGCQMLNPNEINDFKNGGMESDKAYDVYKNIMAYIKKNVEKNFVVLKNPNA